MRTSSSDKGLQLTYYCPAMPLPRAPVYSSGGLVVQRACVASGSVAHDVRHVWPVMINRAW